MSELTTITIAELEAVTEAPDSSYIPIDNGETTNKITVGNFNATSTATATAQALKSEGYAVGKQNGVDVEDGSPYYQNNAAYYSSQANVTKSTVEGYVELAQAAQTTATQKAAAASGSADDAAASVTLAGQSANAAAGYASDAASDASDAEAAKLEAQSAATASSAAAADALSYRTEAINAKNDAEAAADRAESVLVKTPYIGANGNWYIWDADEDDFVDSGEPSRGDDGPAGPAGPQGPQGPQGPKGADGTVEFDDLTPEQKAQLKGDPGETGPQGPEGPTGATGATGPAGADGADGVSPEVTITTITDGHRVTITDATHPGGQSFDVMNGVGDMLASTYDPDSAIATAGGIAEYVSENVAEYVDEQLISEATTTIVNYAPYITIDDAIAKPAIDLKVKVEPDQDLHGYTKPWAGGAGKNLVENTLTTDTSGDIDIVVNDDKTISTSGSSSTAKSFSINTQFTLPNGEFILSGCPSGGNRYGYNLLLQNASTDETICRDIGSGETFTASSSITYRLSLVVYQNTSVTDKTFKPMISTSGGEYEPYSNICPITGHSEAKVTRTGHNFINYNNYVDKSNVTHSLTDTGIRLVSTTNGTYRGGYIYLDNYPKNIALKLSTNIVVTSGRGYIGVFGSDDNSTWETIADISSVTTNIDISLNVPSSDYKYYRVNVNCTMGTSEAGDVTFNNLMLELASDPNTTFEPYNGEIFTIDLDGTRYGGVLDVDAGTLTLTHKSVDLGTLTWSYQADVVEGTITGRFFSSTQYSLRKTASQALSDIYMCVIGASNMIDNCLRIDNSGNICITNTAYTDATTFKTAMDGVQLVYELATPQTITLTPTEVELLLGYNTLWADTGDLSLEYEPATLGNVAKNVGDLTDAKADKSDLASISITGTTNSTGATIASGTYFYLNGALVKAKTGIANGATLTENTNYEVITAGVLNVLHADVDYDNAGAHNSKYRGKYLGSSVTAAQYSAISNGTFEDLYIGDYWTINNVNYRIAAFDYWLKTGDTECTTHHVVIVPDTSLATGKMNSSNTTAGAYLGSGLKSGTNADQTANTALSTATATITTAFGASHILSHKEYFKNAVEDGHEVGGAWVDSSVDLMNENMVYGTNIFSPRDNGATIYNLYTIDKTQLPLFALDHSKITNRESWWLRNVVSGARFAFVGATGNADNGDASASRYVRPVFAIIAST